MDNKTALLYAQLKTYKALVNKTKGFIRWALAQVENPYIACSFGKDSAVMLHLVLSIDDTIPVRFIRWAGETEHIDNYDEVIAKWNLSNLDQIELSRVSLSEVKPERFNSQGYGAFFVGLRTQESTVRRISIKKHGMLYLNASGLHRICPLADWTDKDISAFVISNNLPTLNSYTKHGFESRTASRIPRADFGIREQFLSDLKHRDFNAYQNILLKFPEISN